MSVEVLTTNNFDDIIGKSEKITLVDFYADWCMPCKMIAPILEEISIENDNIAVFKVNIDDSPELASKYAVRSIPNLISFKNGEVYKRSLGVQPKEGILSLTE